MQTYDSEKQSLIGTYYGIPVAALGYLLVLHILQFSALLRRKTKLSESQLVEVVTESWMNDYSSIDVAGPQEALKY